MIDRSRSFAPPGGVLPGWRTVLVLAAWLALVVIGLESGAFWAEVATRPPLLLLLAIIGPPTLFAAAYLLSASFRDYVLALDPRFLTAVQIWRVVGGMFIAVQAQGLLPGLFAYPAGYGDVFTGVFALYALMALLNETPGWQRRLLWLNAIGLLDFLFAIGTGVLVSEGPLGLFQGAISSAPIQHYPLNWIPTFGVPLLTLVHLASLLQLREMRKATTIGAAQSPLAA